MADRFIRSDDELHEAILAADALVQAEDRQRLRKHLHSILQAPADLRRKYNDTIGKLLAFLTQKKPN